MTRVFITRQLILLILMLQAGGSWLWADEPPSSKFPKLATVLAEGETPVKIVCIGDSITGIYYHTGGRRAYPEMVEIALKRAYPKAKVQVINAGISGNTLPQGLTRLQKDVLDHKPQLVTIMYGMNDMTRFSLADFKKNLAEMADRCRKAGAEVLLCTQNSITDGSRTNKKLAEYTQAIQDVGKEFKIPVADCHAAYEAIRVKDAREWSLLLSDEIHPNMDGHKLFASVIARAITGKDDALKEVGPPVPAIPKTLSLLKAKKPIKILAMPPFDKLIGPALKELDPTATVEVTLWPTEGQTLAQLEQAAKKCRTMGMNLIIVAVPLSADADREEQFIRSFSWVLNSSLSFGLHQWDVVAVPPSTVRSKLTSKETQRDQLITRLIAAQDLSVLNRSPKNDSSLEEILTTWLKMQAPK